MRVSGKMTSIMVKDVNNGTTTKSFTLETSSMARRPERANSSSMVTFTKETLLMANSTEKASTISQSQERFTKENSKRIICTEKER
jgi:hypothetical protein